MPAARLRWRTLHRPLLYSNGALLGSREILHSADPLCSAPHARACNTTAATLLCPRLNQQPTRKRSIKSKTHFSSSRPLVQKHLPHKLCALGAVGIHLLRENVPGASPRGQRRAHRLAPAVSIRRHREHRQHVSPDETLRMYPRPYRAATAAAAGASTTTVTDMDRRSACAVGSVGDGGRATATTDRRCFPLRGTG